MHFTVLAGGLAALLAQAAPTSTPSSDGSATALVAALDALRATPQVVWKAAVSESAPRAASGGAMIVDAGAMQSEPFSGTADVLVGAGGEALLCSDETLPEVVLFRKSGRVLTRATFEGTPPSTVRLSDDLLPLLDLDRLGKSVAKVAWTEQVDPATHARTLLGEVDRKLVKTSGGGPMGIAAPKVLRITAKFVLDGDGRLVSMNFGVVRSDPLAGLRERALAGGGTLDFSAESPQEDAAPQEGATAHYDFKPSADAPSERAQQLLAAMREAAGRD